MEPTDTPLRKRHASCSSVHTPETESQFGTDADGVVSPLPSMHAQNVADYHERKEAEPILEPDRLSVTFRHSGWTHNRLLIAKSLRRTNQPDSRRRAFCDCGSEAYVLRSTTDPSYYRLAGSSCHDRFCLPCSQERASHISLNVLAHIETRTVRFVTLTLKASQDPLPDQLDKLYSSFQALRRRMFWKKKVKGGIAFLELTYNPTNHTWHPHFHILVEGSYLDHSQLKRLWYSITTDSFVIDVRSVRDGHTAARYVTKYASKGFNNTFLNRPEPLDECVLAMKGRKLILTFGSWRGLTAIQKPEPGAWEHVAPLELLITEAANGDLDSQVILAALTDTDLTDLYSRAPPIPAYVPPPAPAPEQLTFFDTWNPTCGDNHARRLAENNRQTHAEVTVREP